MLGIELPPEEPKDFGFHSMRTQQKGLWRAAFEQENELFSFSAHEYADNTPEEGFNSWEELRRLGREQDFESVVGVRNRKSFNAALMNIDRERENKRILDAAPWWQSTLAQITAGTLSPTMLLPGGGAVKSVKGGFSIAKSALLTGSWAGMGVAAQEAALQATQQDRTIAEGTLNVAGGVLLGGLLGAGAAGVLTRAERRFLEQQVLPQIYGAAELPPGAVLPKRSYKYDAAEYTLEAYHGSLDVIEKIDPNATHLQRGFFVAEEPELANSFAGRRAVDDDPHFLLGENEYDILPYLTNEQQPRVKKLLDEINAGFKARDEYYEAMKKADSTWDGDAKYDELADKVDVLTKEFDGITRDISAMLEGSPNVIKTRVRLGKNLEIDMGGKFDWDVEAKALEQARAAGYDSITFKNYGDGPDKKFHSILDAENIMDPADAWVPDEITKALADPAVSGLALRSVGADVPTSTITRADYAPKISKGWLVGSSFIPVLRLAQSPFTKVRELAQQLTPSNLKTGMHEKGVAATAGGAIETDMERIYNSSYGRGLKAHKEAYWEHVKNGGKMTPWQFDTAVDMANRFGDQHPDPYVTKAAQGWRKNVAEPLLKMAQENGSLPAELAVLDVNEKLTYIHRSHNRDMIVRNRPVLEERLFPHAQNMVVNARNEALEKMQTKVKNLEEEVRLLELDRAGKEAELKSIEDTIDQINQYFPTEYKLAQQLEEARKSLRQPGLTDDVKAKLKGDIEILKGQLKDTDYYATMAKYKTMRKTISMSVGAMEEKTDKVIESLGDLYEKQTRELTRLINKGKELGTVISKNKPEVWAQKRAELKQMFDDHRVMYYESAANIRDKIWELDYEQQKMEAAIWERTDEASVKSNMAALQEQQKAGKEELEKFKKKAGPIKKQLERELKRQEGLAAKMDRIQDKIDDADWYDNIAAVEVFKDAVRELQETVASNQMLRGMRAQRMVDRLEKYGPPTDLIAKRKEAIDRLKLRYENKWDYKGFDADEAARAITNDYIDSVIGLNDGPPSEYSELFVPVKVGPLKGRAAWVPEEELIKPVEGERGFLHIEAPMTWNHYARVMAGDIALRRQFKSLSMEDEFHEIKLEHDELQKAITDAKTVEEVEQLAGTDFKKWTWTGRKKQDLEATKKDARSFLDTQFKNGQEDLAVMRDKILGRYKVAENNSNFGKMVRAVNAYNYARLMGGATISSLNDLYRPAMVHGLKPYLSEVVGPMLKSTEAWARATDELEAAGTAMEYTLLHRTMSMFELGDPMARGTGVERVLGTLTSVASRWNGLALFTQWGQKFAGVMTMNELVKHAGTGAKSDWFRFLNINEGTERRIAEMWKKHGEIVDGVRVPNTEKWTLGLEGQELRNAEETVRAFRNAVKQEVDSIIVAPGIGDAPNFAATPGGRALLQFMSFNMSAHQKVMLRGLQEGDARLVSTVASMVTIGMGIAAIQAWRNGETSWEKFKQSATNPGFLIGEGLDKSGLMPMLFDLGNRTQSLSRSVGLDFNPIKTPMLWPFPGESQAGDQSRFGITQGAWSFLGPSANLVFGDLPKAGAAVVKAAGGDDLSQSEKKALINPLIYRTMPLMKEFLTRFAIGDN